MKTAIVATVLGIMSNVESADWDYANDGSDWADAKNQCGMSAQSPINIKIEDLQYNDDMDLHFDYSAAFVENKSFTIHNNGHAVQIELREESEKVVHYQGITYIAEQLHFHWGSENTVMDTRYPLEMHIVHYNNDTYGSLGAALGNNDGVLVVGVLFDHNSTTSESVEPFDSILTALASIPSGDRSDFTQPMDNFDLIDLLPNDTSSFVSFPGSLTTPPCTEKVSWVVMRDQLYISEKELSLFKRFPIFGEALATNYREVQPLNGRTISCSWVGEDCQPADDDEVEDEDDSLAYQSSPAGLVVVLSMALAFFSW